jgi:predicted HTH transcriptional regulator
VNETLVKILMKYVYGSKDIPLEYEKIDGLEHIDKIIEIISENKDITIVELANKLDVADKTIKRDIAKLKEQNRLIRVGSLKSGYWEIKE